MRAQDYCRLVPIPLSVPIMALVKKHPQELKRTKAKARERKPVAGENWYGEQKNGLEHSLNSSHSRAKWRDGANLLLLEFAGQREGS
jgi:hypothetical protein